MNQIKVEVIDHMGNDLSTVNAARVSFSKESAFIEQWEYEGNEAPDGFTEDDIVESDISKGMFLYRRLEDRDINLIKYLADHRHMTPFRHNQIQLRCSAPIFLARQLGKHQAGLSWNEVSRRYVDDTPVLYIPDKWRTRPSASIKQGSAGVLDKDSNKRVSNQYYDLMCGIGGVIDLYNYMLEEGVAPEMARMILPQSMMTEWVWSGNLLAFAHVFKERIAEGAQLEAQVFAKQLDNVIRPLFPTSWAALVD